MANFPVHHGITLAGNAYIENMTVEQLSSDPSPVTQGRIWYNNTEKMFKMSTLDAFDAVVVQAFSTSEALLAEITRAQAAEATLQANINAEVTRATNAEATNAANILVEKTRALAAESTLTSNLNTEITRATNAETTLQANIDTEVTRATNAEATLTTNLNAEVTRATNAETTLQANIDTEVTRATNAEATLTTNLNAEITRATNAETTLQSNINAEITRALAAEASLQSAINASATALSWRAGAKAATADPDLAAATTGTVLSTLLPFSDDESPAMVIGDFADGDYLLSKDGATSQLFKIVDVSGTLQLTTSGFDALAINDTFIVQNDLPDSPASQETMAIYTFDGTDIIKVGDFDWSVATGIDLSPSFTSTTGTVVAGDSVEAAIAKLVGNLAATTSTLQANIDAEVTRATNAETTLQANINAEITRATNAETTNAANILVEKTRALAAESTLQANIDAEVTRATNAESTLTTNLNAEITRATNAETTNAANILVEKTRALAAESTLQANIDAEVTRATTAELAEITLRANADVTLQANIDSEVTRATNAEATIAANVLVEKTRALAAEATLQANIDAETTRAIGVEGLLSNLTTTAQSNLVAAINEVAALSGGGVAAETTRALAAEASLSAAINAEVTRATNAEATITANIGDIGSLIYASPDLVTEINQINSDLGSFRSNLGATIFTYNSETSVGAATEHTIQHNLNHAFVDFGILVKRVDGFYYNDIVSLKVVNNNQAVVYLSSSQHVKVIARSADTSIF